MPGNPPPDQLSPYERHLWGLVVENVERGYEIAVLDASGREVATAVALARGFIELQLLNAEREMTVQLLRAPDQRRLDAPTQLLREHGSGEGDLGEKAATGKMAVTQTSLVRAASIRPSRGSFSRAAFAGGNHPVVALSSGDVLAFYDLGVPAAPRLLRELGVSGLLGVGAARDGGVVAWGREGALHVSIDGELITQRKSFEATRVAAWTGRHWALWAEGSIDIHDASFARWASLPLPVREARWIISLGLFLVALDERGPVAIADVRAPSWTEMGDAPAGLDWCGCRVVEHAGKRAMLVRSLDPKAGAVIVEVAPPSTMVVAAHYHEDPWFLRATREGNLYVAIGPDGEATVWQARPTAG